MKTPVSNNDLLIQLLNNFMEGLPAPQFLKPVEGVVEAAMAQALAVMTEMGVDVEGGSCIRFGVYASLLLKEAKQQNKGKKKRSGVIECTTRHFPPEGSI